MRDVSLKGLRSAAVLVLALMAACASTHAVKCDSHLVPINPPHPKVGNPQ